MHPCTIFVAISLPKNNRTQLFHAFNYCWIKQACTWYAPKQHKVTQKQHGKPKGVVNGDWWGLTLICVGSGGQTGRLSGRGGGGFSVGGVTADVLRCVWNEMYNQFCWTFMIFTYLMHEPHTKCTDLGVQRGRLGGEGRDSHSTESIFISLKREKKYKEYVRKQITCCNLHFF